MALPHFVRWASARLRRRHGRRRPATRPPLPWTARGRGPPGSARRWARRRPASSRDRTLREAIAAREGRRRSSPRRRRRTSSSPRSAAEPAIDWPKRHGLPPRRVRRRRPRSPGVLPPLPERPSLLPREGGRVPRPRRAGDAISRPSARATRRCCTTRRRRPRDPRHRRERPPGLHRSAGLRFRATPPTCAWWSSTSPAATSRSTTAASPSLEEVPAHGALADHPASCWRVPRAVAIVPGPAKRAAITAALDGPVTPRLPRLDPAPPPARHPLPRRGLGGRAPLTGRRRSPSSTGAGGAAAAPPRPGRSRAAAATSARAPARGTRGSLRRGTSGCGC